MQPELLRQLNAYYGDIENNKPRCVVTARKADWFQLYPFSRGPAIGNFIPLDPVLIEKLIAAELSEDDPAILDPRSLVASYQALTARWQPERAYGCARLAIWLMRRPSFSGEYNLSSRLECLCDAMALARQRNNPLLVEHMIESEIPPGNTEPISPQVGYRLAVELAAHFDEEGGPAMWSAAQKCLDVAVSFYDDIDELMGFDSTTMHARTVHARYLRRQAQVYAALYSDANHFERLLAASAVNYPGNPNNLAVTRFTIEAAHMFRRQKVEGLASAYEHLSELTQSERLSSVDWNESSGFRNIPAGLSGPAVVEVFLFRGLISAFAHRQFPAGTEEAVSKGLLWLEKSRHGFPGNFLTEIRTFPDPPNNSTGFARIISSMRQSAHPGLSQQTRRSLCSFYRWLRDRSPRPRRHIVGVNFAPISVTIYNRDSTAPPARRDLETKSDGEVPMKVINNLGTINEKTIHQENNRGTIYNFEGAGQQVNLTVVNEISALLQGIRDGLPRTELSDSDSTEIENALQSAEDGLASNDKTIISHALDILGDILKRITATLASSEIQPQLHTWAAAVVTLATKLGHAL